MSERRLSRGKFSRADTGQAVAIKRRFGWLGGVIAALGLALVTLKRLCAVKSVKHAKKP